MKIVIQKKVQKEKNGGLKNFDAEGRADFTLKYDYFKEIVKPLTAYNIYSVYWINKRKIFYNPEPYAVSSTFTPLKI